MIEELPVIEWFPPDGSGPITFGRDGDFKLLLWSGGSTTRTGVLLRKSAGQVGSTVVDRTVSERHPALQCLVKGVDIADFNTQMEMLVRALAGVPGDTSRPRLGTLRVHQPGLPVVEALAEPVDSPQEAVRVGGTIAKIDIEWLSSPLWREVVDRIVTLEVVPPNPWVSPWFSPWTSPAAQSSAAVINTGHVPVGFRARFFGPQNTVRLVNSTTMEQLQVFGAIGVGEVVEVDTEARMVSVNGSSALDRWDFGGTWWKLQPGEQTVTAEANTADPTAGTVVIWRPVLAGV